MQYRIYMVTDFFPFHLAVFFRFIPSFFCKKSNDFFFGYKKNENEKMAKIGRRRQRQTTTHLREPLASCSSDKLLQNKNCIWG